MADKSPLRRQSDFTREHYAYLSDDLNFSRGISQIAPEEIPISSGENQIYPPRDLKIERDCYEFAQFIL